MCWDEMNSLCDTYKILLGTCILIGKARRNQRGENRKTNNERIYFHIIIWRLLRGRLRKEDSDQIRSVAYSCLTLCDPMNCSTPGLPAHHQLPEFTETHVHQVSDAIQPSHPLLSSSPLAPNPSQRQSLFQWVNSSHEVAKVLELQLQHQSFQWISRTDDLL